LRLFAMVLFSSPCARFLSASIAAFNAFLLFWREIGGLILVI